MAPKPVIRVGHLRITDHLILGVTLNQLAAGSEKFQNFDLVTQAFTGWNPISDALRNGTIDAACILAPLAMELFHSGVKIRMVMQTHKSGSIIVTNKRANIKTMQDFKGKTVLIPHYLSVHNMLFDKLLRDNGIDVGVNSDVTFEVVAPSDIPEIIEWDEKGSVGGFIVAEPFGTQVVKAGYGEEFALSKDIWPNHPCCVLVLKEDIIHQNPDAVQELVSSLVASGQFIAQNPDGAAEVGAKFLNQDMAIVRHVLTTPRGRVTTDELYPDFKGLDQLQTYLTSTIHALSNTIDLNEFVIPKFAEKAGAK